jgi:hypothetical protein
MFVLSHLGAEARTNRLARYLMNLGSDELFRKKGRCH